MKLYKSFIIALGAWFAILSTPVTADTVLPIASWTDMTTSLGIQKGEAATLQNVGRTALRITTSELEPATTSEGLIAPPDSVITFDVRPVGQNRIWVFNTGASLTGQVASVKDMSVTPSASVGSPLDFEIELAAGRIPGKFRILKFGSRNALPGTTGDFAVIWDGPTDNYVPPTQARIHDLVSTSIQDAGTLISSGTITTTSAALIIDSSATFITDGVSIGDAVVNDTDCSLAIIGVISIDSETQLTVAQMVFPETGLENGANDIGDTYRVIATAGTGAAITYIQGLDAGRLFQNEFVINNGLTDVPTVKSYLRQTRMRAFEGGTAQSVVGVITSTAQTDLTVSAQINNGANQTLMVVQTIPLDKRGYIKTWRTALTRKQAATSTVRLRVGVLDGINYISREEALSTTGTSNFEHSMGGFILPPGIDVWIEADADSVNVGVSGSLDIILEDI